VPAGSDLTMSKNKTLQRSNSIVACVFKIIQIPVCKMYLLQIWKSENAPFIFAAVLYALLIKKGRG
jgi:hypothetical protein